MQPPSQYAPPWPPQPPAPQNAQFAAMMWQMQMQGQQSLGMAVPPWPPAMPMSVPLLKVSVHGLKFDYQLTEEDVKKVFARYGDVKHVNLDKEGTSATVQLEQPHQAIAAQHDLNNKQLSGMSGGFLRVEVLGGAGAQPPSPCDPMAHMAAAMHSYTGNPMMSPPVQGYPMVPPPVAPTQSHTHGHTPGPAANGSKKHTCKIEVGIENDGEFRVASRVIQIARQIWQDRDFQNAGGKSRVRGKGIGGAHEADEPLALCISCSDQRAFNSAVSHAENQLQKIHFDYKAFCEQNGLPIPELAVKVSEKGGGRGDFFPGVPNADPPRGERPATAPSDQEIEQLIEERNEARKSQNFARADEVRDYLKSRGVVLMDEKQAKGNLKGRDVTKWRFWRP